MEFNYAVPRFVSSFEYTILPFAQTYTVTISNSAAANGNSGTINLLNISFASEAKIKIRINKITYRDTSNSDVTISRAINSSFSTSIFFHNGTGTASDPYIIMQVRHLQNVSKITVDNKYCALGTNLNLSGTQWTPLEYKGYFSGNNYTISNLTINTTPAVTHVGLFGLGAVKLSNLTLSGVNINIGNLGVGYFVGAAIGGLAQSGTIKNVQVSSGTVSYKGIGSTVGGIAGESYGSITNCVNRATVTGSCFVGGIIGQNYGICSYNTNYGTVNFDFTEYWFSLDYQCVGGIVGIMWEYDGTITNNTNYGNIVYITAAKTVENPGKYIQPRMGLIIGLLKNSTFDTSNINSGGSINCTNLKTITYGGFLGIGATTHYQALYAAGANRLVGKTG